MEDRAQKPGLIEQRVVPGEGATVSLHGTIDVRVAGELEATLTAAHNAHPPVTVDLSDALAIDSAIVDVLAEVSATFADGLRVVGARGGRANSFELTQVEHLLEK